MLIRRLSIGTRFFLLLFAVLALNAAGYLLILQNVYTEELRSQAKTVVANVEAFGAWVAKGGRVWVKAEKSESYLSQEDYSQAVNNETKTVHFFSKNPALAQREFSEAVLQSTSPAKFRMTSHNVMNPINLPDAFELRALSAIQETALPEYIEFIGGAYRYAKPVYHQASCINCHGDPAKAPADVILRYGKEKGFGFKEGDLAGVISVTIPTEKIWTGILKFVGFAEIALIVSSMAIFMLMVRLWVVLPIRKLTQAAQDISLGKDVSMDSAALSEGTRNEIHQLTQALNRLRSSMQISIKKMREARELVAKQKNGGPPLS
jgi:HAMP domain-containing protein